MKVIVTHPVTEQQKKEFQAAAPNAELLFLSVDDVSEELLAEASVVIGTIPPSRFHAYENLQLLSWEMPEPTAIPILVYWLLIPFWQTLPGLMAWQSRNICWHSFL